jgi:Putative auto-transporter adhesin, head GIN domain
MTAIHRHTYLFSGVFIATLGVAGCYRSEGNGHLVLEHRNATGFTQVENQTSLAVNIVQGTCFSVDVRVDSNLMPLVETRVEGGVLRIDETEPFDADPSSEVSVVLPSLDSADNTGSGDMTVQAQQAGDLRLGCTGSGSLTFVGSASSLSGQVCGSGSLSAAGSGGHLSLRVTGSGSADASGFDATGGAELETVGSGSLSAHVTGDATLATSGSGSIDATLNGGTASLSVTGSGSITWSGDESVSSAVRAGSGSIDHR